MPSSRESADSPKPAVSPLFEDKKPKEERSRRSRKDSQQSEFQLGGATSDRGRFQDVAPTIYDGADLDIPTFVRRGIRLPT
jgi:hypothetical protein